MAESSFAVLNLGSQRVSGAVFSKARNGDLLLKAFAFAEMQGDPTVEATRLPQLRIAVLELADKLKLRGKDLWYSIAGHVVFTRFVKLPPFNEERADQIVEFEARQNVPFPINEVIWDYEFVGEEGGAEREVVLVAIKADALSDINEQIEVGGVKVAGVDLSPLAVSNSFRYSYPDVEESSLIVDLGAKSTNLIFVEGSRVFTRNILVGGSVLTAAIAKELGLSFSEAERFKRDQGYVAPGGAFEPNPDETVDAVSKIMRNTMTRLHGEIVRTVNYYRSQQGGSAPRRIFLCGGGAQIAMVADFFTEKFGLPVEILNPLRGVQLDRRVDELQASANAPALAELVGLALRHAGACPLEVELVPDTVSTARDAAKRAPFLMMSAVCLFAVLGVGVLYFQKAAEVVNQKLQKSQSVLEEVRRHSSAIAELEKQQQLLIGQSGQLERVVVDRSYWTLLLDALNNKLENDYLWITQLEVLKDGNPMTPALGSAVAAPVVAPAPVTGAPVDPVYQLGVQGLWRKNDLGNEQVVYKFFDDVKSVSTIFIAPPADQKPEVNTGLEDDRYAYDFKFRIPLVKGMKFDK
ncbi:MAG: Amuc_1101 family PilM-like pilus complex protein [Roseimicrobium sp.]